MCIAFQHGGQTAHVHCIPAWRILACRAGWTCLQGIHVFGPQMLGRWVRACVHVQGLLAAESVDTVMAFMVTQGNPAELRRYGHIISHLPSTVQYHDRR